MSLGHDNKKHVLGAAGKHLVLGTHLMQMTHLPESRHHSIEAASIIRKANESSSSDINLNVCSNEWSCRRSLRRRLKWA
jgi:hypothetical protein